MEFESHWPKGAGGVSFLKRIVDDEQRTLTDHNSSPEALRAQMSYKNFFFLCGGGGGGGGGGGQGGRLVLISY